MEERYRALVVKRVHDQFIVGVDNLNTADIPENDLLIKVNYSSINYKDVLSAKGTKGITKNYPHVPGIDAVGEVVRSSSDLFELGDLVIVTGYDLGMNTWGGFGQYISVPAHWAVKLPENMTQREAAAYGTAGLTAGLCINEIVNHVPAQASIVVNGCTGGVGSIAVSILSGLGFRVTSLSRRADRAYLLHILGAHAYQDANSFIELHNSKPLSKATYHAGIDVVGGDLLSAMLKSAKYGGIVTSCGNVGSAEISTSVFPFILRGVKLSGIDSVEPPIDSKARVWKLLAEQWKPHNLDKLISEISLHELTEALEDFPARSAGGRVIINHNL
ncbi:YhdH/YhfP family quinone oxidoreductase [Sphingobacterium griseoflavum]|uniref:Oxidoreductase n=1 Tax=Sphingobacterium griseoflavum TaxID=1474952 RepID=A0ABQ3I0J8_9SPHI|nr:YhdH/YhfP family quinone oxidoreductase [Sphingobacterium griseoflavum]GHE45862.1 oxidoreductase [Sphingobacterium griseoflavum]